MLRSHNDRRNTMHKRSRRIIATAVTVLALGGLASSQALAGTLDTSMNAFCGNGYVSAEGPDIHLFQYGWADQYRFRVQRYTTAGWQAYYTSVWRTSYSSDTFSPGSYSLAAPAHTYMRVIVDQSFYYYGVYQGANS